MLFDLNVPWTANTAPAPLERTISFLSSLGYQTLALNHTPSIPLPAQLNNPIPSTQPFVLPKNTTLLTRCTLTIHDPSQNHRLTQLATHYDILALRPTTEKAFLAACLTLMEHSIISLDLTQRFPFHFKPKPLMTAINRGVRFEICYANATLGDSGARRNFISNVMGIMRATKGRGLIISSGGMGDVVGIRPPADVVNLLSVWGLARERGLESLGVNPRGVVVNEGIKRNSYRGVIEIVDGGEREVSKLNETQEGSGKKTEKSLHKQQQRLQEHREETPGDSTPNSGKRKPEESIQEGTPTMSKRQAKRIRLAALKASQEESSGQTSASDIASTSKISTPKSKAKG